MMEESLSFEMLGLLINNNLKMMRAITILGVQLSALSAKSNVGFPEQEGLQSSINETLDNIEKLINLAQGVKVG